MTDNAVSASGIRAETRSETERAVIASMLFAGGDSAALDFGVNTLDESDFIGGAYRAVFKAVKGLYADKTPVDLVTVNHRLIAAGDAELVGGMQGLVDIADSVATSANMRYYAGELLQMGASARLRKRVTDVLANTPYLSAEDLQRVIDAENGQRKASLYIAESLESLDGFMDTLGKPRPRINTGYGHLDRMIGGFRVPSVAMVGAYPSVGKTTFALNIADKQDGPVVFFSLEMSGEMILERLASAALKIDYQRFSSQRLTDMQIAEIRDYMEQLKAKRFHVFDGLNTVEEQMTAVHEIKPRLVCVDYIQKVRTLKRTDSRRAEIDYISGQYKQMALRNNCVVLLLSQLSRAGGDDPRMSNLKESSALEADGDYVMILNRPYVMKKGEDGVTPEMASILVDKNKFGEAGKFGLHFVGMHQRFYESDLDVDNPFL